LLDGGLRAGTPVGNPADLAGLPSRDALAMKHARPGWSSDPAHHGEPMSDLNRFLGGSPGAVGLKLLFLSLLVGAFMALLGITPFGLIAGVVDWVRSAFDLSFETLGDIARWVLYGAVVVVPIWLISRLFSRR
jgi:hypothetical protein